MVVEREFAEFAGAVVGGEEVESDERVVVGERRRCSIVCSTVEGGWEDGGESEGSEEGEGGEDGEDLGEHCCGCGWGCRV